MDQKPSVGRIVHYKLTEQDAQSINRRRDDFGNTKDTTVWAAGAQAHFGNRVIKGHVFPMVVCVVWPDEHGTNLYGVNGQVLLDGNDSVWVTSARQGDEPGQWNWPPRV